MLVLAMLAASASAQSVIPRFVVASGGTRATSTNFSVHATVGQPVVGNSAGTNLRLRSGYWSTGPVPTGVGDTSPRSPSYALDQNYPNPFNPRTTIAFVLPRDTHVRLRIFDAAGAEVARLIDASMQAGAHRVEFDAAGLASGVYFYRLEVAGFRQARKLVLLK
jgi:hypothetical protein